MVGLKGIDMSVEFQVAGGTVMGREHYRLHGNRQDAFRIERHGDVTVAVVCDGCGDPGSPSSEMGAAIGARMIAYKLTGLFGEEKSLLATPAGVEEGLERVRRSVLASIRKLVKEMGEESREVIRDCFLFTAVGCVIGPTHGAFFSIGDGVIIINGEATVIGPFPDNAPPYMAYALLGEFKEQCDLRFTINKHLPTTALHSFLIGTDGICDLMKQGVCLPGTNEPVGEMSNFWETDQNYANPYALSNRLRLINTDQTRIDWQGRKKTTESGKLADDTTMVVGRRT